MKGFKKSIVVEYVRDDDAKCLVVNDVKSDAGLAESSFALVAAFARVICDGLQLDSEIERNMVDAMLDAAKKIIKNKEVHDSES